MTRTDISFKDYLLNKQNILWLIAAAIIGVIYFIVLRILFPIPSYYADSFTWVGAAQTLQPITMRPIGYSKMMYLFKFLSRSDLALIAGQYFSNLFVNLFLFFSFTYLFTLRQGLKVLLFILLIANPFYILYSNYISSDPFFNCLAVLWFTLLIWMIYRPSWSIILLQLVVLFGLFELRYNAIFFPAISTIAFILSKQSIVRKVAGIALNVALVATIVIMTSAVTKKYTGTRTFSAFSGWQLANDALHVMRHDKIDTAAIKDKEAKAFTVYARHFFDTTKQIFPDSAATAFFMWYFNSPLKGYMRVYHGRSKWYFNTWNALGPIYNEFGKAVILQHPLTYVQHFVLPNSKAYFFPPLEIYETYMEKHDTIALVAQKLYQYSSKKAPPHHPIVYAAVFEPNRFLFEVLNFLFVLFALYYFVSKKYLQQKVLFNQTLLCFTAFYFANLFFIVLLAPSVFRYHVFILTLLIPIMLLILQQVFKPMYKQTTALSSFHS